MNERIEESRAERARLRTEAAVAVEEAARSRSKKEWKEAEAAAAQAHERRHVHGCFLHYLRRVTTMCDTMGWSFQDEEWWPEAVALRERVDPGQAPKGEPLPGGGES